MSAGAALQAALATRLAAIGEVEVYDGAPARAAYPYVSLDAGTERDWGHKSNDGREVMVSTTLWHDQPAALHGLADAVEAGGAGDWIDAGGGGRVAAGEHRANAAANRSRCRGAVGGGDRFSGAVVAGQVTGPHPAQLC